MLAITFRINPLGWATCKWLRHFWPGCLRSRLNGIALSDLPPPELPGEDWVRVRTRLGGICGSDVGILAQRQPPDSILQAFSSWPGVLGHENVAEVAEVGSAVDRIWLGRRVVVEPTLSCRVRGIDPPCPRCAAGEFGACENFADDSHGRYRLPPGTTIGYNARTGGSFGEYFVAHQSQLLPVPDELPDEQAVLTDPLACALHAVLRAGEEAVGRVLVYGSGMLGLGVVACLRAMDSKASIDLLGRSAWLEPIARSLGADEYLRLPAGRRERLAVIAQRTGGTVRAVRFGNDTITGGYDLVFDCVGSRQSLNESLKWTREKGRIILVATASGGRLDLTPLWLRELSLVGATSRQTETVQGRRVDTSRLVLEWLAAGRLRAEGLLTHTFRVQQYRQAFDAALAKGRHRAIRIAFDFRQNQGN